MNWKDVITDPDEIKVFMALDGPKYTWRTVSAIARQTGLSEDRVLEILARYNMQLTRLSDVPSASGTPLAGLLERVGTLTSNESSALGLARANRQVEELRIERERLLERIREAEEKLANLQSELDQRAAPDQVDARRVYLNAVFVLSLAAILGIGFVFFAEFTLKAMGFDNWSGFKLYLASVVFWLGTLVTMHIYLSGRGESDFSSLPWAIRVVPLLLILSGVLVLAIGRVLIPLLAQTSGSGSRTQLANYAIWSLLISQLALSLGLDLGSGLLSWVGVRKYSSSQPIWQRYKGLTDLANQVGLWKDMIAEIDTELADFSQPSQQKESQSEVTQRQGSQHRASLG